MHWIIEAGPEGEDLQRVCARRGLRSTVVKVIPFAHDLAPEPVLTPGEPVIAFGSTTLVQIAGQRGWTPGVYWSAERFTFEAWRAGYHGYLINHDAVVSRLADAVVDELAFVRPCDDHKQFAGQLLDAEAFRAWRERIVQVSGEGFCSVTPETQILVASPKVLLAEWRFFIVDGQVVTGSLYRWGGRLTHRRLEAPIDSRTDPLGFRAWEFAQCMTRGWQPARAFVLDVALDADFGLGVLEVNTLNAAGRYAADPEALVRALEAAVANS